ncbi:MAG TPA: antibiotic biosynthesis monooxygenase [bacterium]
MIRSIIRLNVEAGHEYEFEIQFRERGVLRRAREIAQMRTAELLRPLAGGPYTVIATWDSAEDYAVWVNSPIRGELSATPPQLSQPVAPADLYEIVERFE